MINVRKILLICLMIAVFASLVYTVVKGVDISGYDVLGYMDIEDEYERLEDAKKEYESKNESGISSKEDILAESIEKYNIQKAKYEETLKQKQIQLQSINAADCYDIDFIWTKVGNYARERNLTIELNVTKNVLDVGEEQYILANLNFTTQGYIVIGDPENTIEQSSYVAAGLIDEPFGNLADFLRDIEDDERLDFELRDLNIIKEKTEVIINKGLKNEEKKEAYILKSTFNVCNIPLNRDTLTVLTSKDEKENQSLTQEGKGDVLNITEEGETVEQTENPDISNTTF